MIWVDFHPMPVVNCPHFHPNLAPSAQFAPVTSNVALAQRYASPYPNDSRALVKNGRGHFASFGRNKWHLQ